MIIPRTLRPVIKPPAHPQRSDHPYGTARLGARCPRHFVPGYDQAVPPGHLPLALTQQPLGGKAQYAPIPVTTVCARRRPALSVSGGFRNRL
jgi:hypothetical protein